MNQTFKQHNIFQPTLQQPIFHSRFCSLVSENESQYSPDSLSNFVAMLCLRLVPDSAFFLFPQFSISIPKILFWQYWPLHCTYPYIESDLIFYFCQMAELNNFSVRWRLSNFFEFCIIALIRISNCLLKLINLQIMVPSYYLASKVTNHYFL